MSEKPIKETKTTKTAVQPKQQVQQAPPADVYTAEEFIANARTLFDVTPDIAAAALECAGIVETTIDNAKKVVKAFAERKV